MSVDVRAEISRIFQEFNTTMMEAFDDAPRVWEAFGVEIPSSSRSTLHGWLADQAVVREWKGKRKLNSMGTRFWEVINRDWELSYSFEVNQIRDDLSGLVTAALMRARSDGKKWARHEDLLMATTLALGTSMPCFDGQFFFDTDHPVDPDGIVPGTFSNSLNLALTHAAFYTVLQTLETFLLEDGSPMVAPDAELTLVAPPALRPQAESILLVKNLTPAASFALFGTSGVSENPLFGRAKLLINPWLTQFSTTRWYVTAKDGDMRPLMMQRRQAVETNEQGVGSQLYFDEKKVSIGQDSRYEASYTFPQLAVTSSP